jgi:hypothetical protein
VLDMNFVLETFVERKRCKSILPLPLFSNPLVAKFIDQKCLASLHRNESVFR